MTTAPLSYPVGRTLGALAARHFASSRLDRLLLTLIFAVLFLQYCFERSDLIRAIPLAGLAVVACLALLRSPARVRRESMLSVFRPGTVLLISVVCLPALISSLYRPESYPFQYGAALLVAMVCVRILLSTLGLERILLCYFWAATIGLLIIVALSAGDLVTSFGRQRYAPFFFDPNRIAFFAATAVPVQLWFAARGRSNKLALAAVALGMIVVLAASSRGSLGALVISAVATAALLAARFGRLPRLRVPRGLIIVSLALVCGLTAFLGSKPELLTKARDYLGTKLEFTSRERGMDSGFTGRNTNWSILLRQLPKTDWLAGNGYRTSESDFAFPVDNGYIAGLYELGLLATLAVVARFGWVLVTCATGFLARGAAWPGMNLVCLSTALIFLSNAFVHRVLLGCGDPASLLMLFLFVSFPEDLQPRARGFARSFPARMA